MFSPLLPLPPRQPERIYRPLFVKAADVKVVEGKKLQEYVRKYYKKWVQKI